jgi:hypothetical protein
MSGSAGAGQGREAPSRAGSPARVLEYDELVLEAAVNGRASALVTHNLRDFQPAARMFKLRVMLPRELLKELEA